MESHVLTNGLRYAVYERLFDSSNLVAVFSTAEAAEDYKESLRRKSKSKDTDYYTKNL